MAFGCARTARHIPSAIVSTSSSPPPDGSTARLARITASVTTRAICMTIRTTVPSGRDQCAAGLTVPDDPGRWHSSALVPSWTLKEWRCGEPRSARARAPRGCSPACNESVKVTGRSGSIRAMRSLTFVAIAAPVRTSRPISGRELDHESGSHVVDTVEHTGPGGSVGTRTEEEAEPVPRPVESGIARPLGHPRPDLGHVPRCHGGHDGSPCGVAW